MRRLIVHVELLSESLRHLRQAGRAGCEGLALWAGTVVGDDVEVQQVIIPEQRAIRTESGLCVIVTDSALHDLNVRLYKARLKLVAQMHSHGDFDICHSETDDAGSIVTLLGGMSIVVPGFAQGPFRVARCGVYRLNQTGWMALTPKEARALIHIVE